MSMRIERLTRAHDRSAFDCGEPSLNNFLQRVAMQHDERGIGRTFVAVGPEDVSRILGYYTLAAGSVAFENVPDSKRLPSRMPVPVVLLGRLAEDIRRHGTGLGGMLLLHALWRASTVAEQAGVYAVEVDALNDAAARFYARYGFTPLLDNPRHMYLPMKLIRALELPGGSPSEE